MSFPHVVSDGSITPGQHASFLGKLTIPSSFEAIPMRPIFALPELQLPSSVDLSRLENRRQLLQVIDRQVNLKERFAEARSLDTFQEQALSMLTSPKLKRAFELDREPSTLRDAYGRTTYGQSCLLARRLIEVGVRFRYRLFFARDWWRGK